MSTLILFKKTGGIHSIFYLYPNNVLELLTSWNCFKLNQMRLKSAFLILP